MTSNVSAMEIDASNASHSSHAARAPQQLALPRDAPIPDGNFVALDVDGRKYRIRKSDLMSVPYFGALLGGNWAGIDLLPDGSLPIDTDPEIWPILFTYIKRPSIYPLLWTREKGFDYVGYNKLLSEAKFLGLEDLQQWILSKRYKEVITTRFKTHMFPGKNLSDEYEVETTWLDSTRGPRRLKRDPQGLVAPDVAPEDVELVSCFEANITSQGPYKCPIGHYLHGDLDDCIAENCPCPPDQSGAPLADYEKLPTSIVAVYKYIDYHPERCEHGYVGPDHNGDDRM